MIGAIGDRLSGRCERQHARSCGFVSSRDAGNDLAWGLHDGSIIRELRGVSVVGRGAEHVSTCTLDVPGKRPGLSRTVTSDQ